MKTRKTKYVVEGRKEPCWEISSDDGFVMVRLAPYYHYYGKTTILATEFLSAKFNASEEFEKIEFDKLNKRKATDIASSWSAYLR